MRRNLMTELKKWKDSPRRKPLILNGARQVGKTWLLREFGRTEFESVAYVNFDNNPALSQQFNEGFDIERLILALQVESGVSISPQKTLIIFDEIQECPRALTSLKYFQENAPEYAIAAAGSLLGLLDHEGTGYPVGKVENLNLYPFSFREFLDAVGDEELRSLIDRGDTELLDSFATPFIARLRQYYYVGGMPEAVDAFVATKQFTEARSVQEQILIGYERDIAKHRKSIEIEYTLAAWKSLPAHLGQENKKFIFGHIKDGARARDYRSAITWLTRAGIAYQVPRISQAQIPLSAFADDSVFKLFCLDVGLLGAMVGLDEKSVIEGNSIFGQYKGAFVEQYVCQQLVADCGLIPYYWSATNSKGEIDFIVQDGEKITAIEVKAEENIRSRSLNAFAKRYPETIARRFSVKGFHDQGWMKNVPLYAIGNKANWE